jgi:hypothetical protein
MLETNLRLCNTGIQTSLSSVGLDGDLNFYSSLLIYNIITIALLMVYILDNTVYACAYGLKKKERIKSLCIETTLILTIMGLNVYELVDTNMRFN